MMREGESPMNRIKTCVVLVVAAIAATMSNNAFADRTLERAQTVHPGQKLQIAAWYYYTDLQSCTPSGMAPAFRARTAPNLGALSNAEETAPDHHCRDVVSPGRAIYYQAGQQPGIDRFSYYVIYPSQFVGAFTINETITVK